MLFDSTDCPNNGETVQNGACVCPVDQVVQNGNCARKFLCFIKTIFPSSKQINYSYTANV